MVLTAWRMDSSDADQRTPHQLTPNVPVSKEALVRLGVLSWALDVSGPPEANELLNSIRKERGYTYTDTITISPEKLENYEGKLKIFFKEHLHTDEEIRLILVSCSPCTQVHSGLHPWPCCCLLSPPPHPLTHSPQFLSGGHWLL
jgi:cupin superfamily acireductone dioxygenase involved in methionine salvage